MKGDSASADHERYYGTFQGQPRPPPPAVAMGIPQPVPPPGAYYSQGYQAVPGYPSHAEGYPYPTAPAGPEPRSRERRLPCCGLGIGWALFIIGFIFASIPWYVGAFLLLCVRQDYREKPGLLACTIAFITIGIKADHTFQVRIPRKGYFGRGYCA